MHRCLRSWLAIPLVLLAACQGAGQDPATTPTDPGGSPAPSGSIASIGGCQVFPADNAWNRDVSADPVDPSSGALLAQMSPDAAVHLDLGTTEEYYGIPYTVVPASQPLVPITYGTDGTDYSDESDPGPMPIPLDAPIEGGSTTDPNPTSGDRHVLVVQQGGCILYELYNTVRADFDLTPYTGDALVIVKALQRYGLLFADQGSAWYVTGTSDPRWEAALDQLRAHPVYGHDFEVLKLGAITSC